MRSLYLITSSFLLVLFFTCQTTGEYLALPDADNLHDYVDKKVCLQGRVSQTPWQHMIASLEGYPYDEYFDVGDYQIVIYLKSRIDCPGPVRVYGRVVMVEGAGKRPQPGDEPYREYHLAVDTWECPAKIK
jgi:hypothetical protein